MRGILIFDQLNDIIFSKYDKKFSRHIFQLGKRQGLVPENYKDEDRDSVSRDILMQIFSPVVQSQKIMTTQFGNSYASIKCYNGTNLVLDEYMGFLFIHIGLRDVTWLKRTLSVCICIVQHICGPDVLQLKHNQGFSERLSHLLDTWISLVDSDQACFLEAVEQLAVNPDVNGAVITALRQASGIVHNMTGYPRCHTLIFVQRKLLSLYSSREAEDLTPADILFLNVLTESYRRSPLPVREYVNEQLRDSTDGFYSPPSTPTPRHSSGDQDETLFHEQVVLTGNNVYRPHAVHVAMISHSVSLVILYQTSPEKLCKGLHDAFSSLVCIQNIQTLEQVDEPTIRRVVDVFESSMKKIFESLKKNKVQTTPQLEIVIKQLQSKSDQVKKKFQEMMRERTDCLEIDALACSLLFLLRSVLSDTTLDRKGLDSGREAAQRAALQVERTISDFTEFLMVKAIRNFTLGSRTSVTIKKYMEEFPGLVHFMYIDRTNQRIIAPCLDFTSAETVHLTKKKIWSMVEFSRTHLQEGHLSVLWKDTTFHYSYCLWFQDSTGSPEIPKVSPSIVAKHLPTPGLFVADFYRKLTEACFPKVSTDKLRCFELYCIHLGLTTSSCVLEHCRRLAATIFEVTGQPNPLDVL